MNLLSLSAFNIGPQFCFQCSNAVLQEINYLCTVSCLIKPNQICMSLNSSSWLWAIDENICLSYLIVVLIKCHHLTIENYSIQQCMKIIGIYYQNGCSICKHSIIYIKFIDKIITLQILELHPVFVQKIHLRLQAHFFKIASLVRKLSNHASGAVIIHTTMKSVHWIPKKLLLVVHFGPVDSSTLPTYGTEDDRTIGT